MARRVRRRSTGGTRTATRAAAPQARSRARKTDNEGIIPVLARAVREVEASAQRGPVKPSGRTKFQVVAQLAREERARVRADQSHSEAYRAEQLKRLDGIGTILAKTAARDTSLLQLLAEDAIVSDSARDLKHDMMAAAGLEAPVEAPPAPDPSGAAATSSVTAANAPSRCRRRSAATRAAVRSRWRAASSYRPAGDNRSNRWTSASSTAVLRPATRSA